MSRWERFDPTDPQTCREAAGCYVIVWNRWAQYVGQSENVRRRIRGYRCERVQMFGTDGRTATPWGDFLWNEGPLYGLACYPKKFGEHLMIEARLIRRLGTRYNVRGART